MKTTIRLFGEILLCSYLLVGCSKSDDLIIPTFQEVMCRWKTTLQMKMQTVITATL